LETPEESEAVLERRARTVWEFRQREEVLQKWAVRSAWVRWEQLRVRPAAGPERVEVRLRGDFRARVRGFRACAGL